LSRFVDHVFGCFSVRGVRKHRKQISKNKSDFGPFLAPDPTTHHGGPRLWFFWRPLDPKRTNPPRFFGGGACFFVWCGCGCGGGWVRLGSFSGGAGIWRWAAPWGGWAASVAGACVDGGAGIWRCAAPWAGGRSGDAF
jgi:hypothetical protein